MDRRHRTLFVVRPLDAESCYYKAARTGMRLCNILLTSLCGTSSRERLLLSCITVARLPLVIARVLKLLLGPLRDSKQVRSSLAQEPLIEPVAQGTLSLPDGSLDLALSDPSEDDFLPLISQLLWRHAPEVQLHLRRREPSLYLGEPVAIP